MNRKNLRYEFSAVTMLLVMAFISALFFSCRRVNAASPEITESYVGYYDQYHNDELRMHYKAKMHKVDGQKAYCISMTKSSEPGAAKEVNIKKFLPGDELVMACLAQKHIFEMDGYTANEKYMLTQCMVWYIQRDHIGDGGWRQYVSDIDMSVSEQKKFYADLEKRVKGEASRYEGQGTAWENIDVEDVQEVGILLEPTLKTGDMTLKKTSFMPEFVKGNACYSLAGAEYGVYEDSACTKSVGTFVTDKDGNTEKITVEAGTYYIKEKKASKGYLLDETVHKATVGFGDNKTISVKETPGFTDLLLLIEKLDKESQRAEAKGEASLEGAEFTVCYYDGYFEADKVPDYDSYTSAAKRKWVLKTTASKKDGNLAYLADMQNPECKAGGDAYYRVRDKDVLPLGTITIRETKAPKGYTLKNSYLENAQTKEKSTGAAVTQVLQKENGKAAQFQAGNRYKAFDQVIRGDLSLRKVNGKNDKAMAGITFQLTSKTTGESHRFVTDENGEYSTASAYIPHSLRTNKGEAGDGIWFVGTKTDAATDAAADGTAGAHVNAAGAAVDDKLGALPYDTYELCELRGEANTGAVMYRDTVTIRRDNTVVELNNIENYKIEIHTTAKGKTTGTHEITAENPAEIVDTVKCRYLEENKRYRLRGTLMVKESGEVLTDKDGEAVSAEKEFTAKSSVEEIEVLFSFDAEKLEGKNLVVFEELYEVEDTDDKTPDEGESSDKEETPDKEEETLVAEHKDIEDEGQTILVKEKPKKIVTPKDEEKVKTAKEKVKKAVETVKTGDTAKVGVCLAIMAAAFAVILFKLRKRHS